MSKILGVNSPKPNQVKNYIINGNFDIWQRGASLTWASGTKTFLSDRWYSWNGGGGSASTTASQSTSSLPTGSRYVMRCGRTSGNAITGQIRTHVQEIDRDYVIGLRNKKCTISFLVRRGTTDQGTSSGSLEFYTGTGSEGETIFGGYTGSVTQVNSGSLSITTSFVLKSFTFTMPSNATTAAFRMVYTPTGTADANEYIDLAQVMLNEGSVAAPFQIAGSTIAEELIACQRYYEKSYALTTDPQTATKIGAVIINTVSSIINTARYGSVRLRVTKRAMPAIAIYPVIATISSGVVTDLEGSNLAANSGSTINVGDSAFDMKNTSGGTLTLTSAYSGVNFHYTADAEL